MTEIPVNLSDGEREQRFDKLLEDEADRLLAAVRPSLVDEWVLKTSGDVLSGRVVSAGPTRSGKLVQVRFRLGKRLAASSHSLDTLRDKSLDFRPPSSLKVLIKISSRESITSAGDQENALVNAMREGLQTFYLKLPAEVTEGQDRSKFWRTASNKARGVGLASLLLAVPGVEEKLVSLVEDAVKAILAVPYARFPDAGRRNEHLKGKKALLEAMKVALVAGVTDEEIEDIKRQALVFQVMQ